MNVVVDTNILFSFFWNGSVTHRMLTALPLEFITLAKSIEELKKYAPDIQKKAGLSKGEWNQILKEMQQIVKVIPLKGYLPSLKKAQAIAPDPADAEFLALCIQESCILWSNDAQLKRQQKVRVLSTQEMIGLMF